MASASGNYPINKISSENLRAIEKIGKGQFGDVHVCETCGSEGDSESFNLCVVYTLDDAKYLEEFKR